MSTRGQIRITGLKSLVYKHQDAYPAGILPILLPFVARFWKRRGFDPEYCLFRYAAELLRDEAEYLKEYSGDPKDEVLGYGISDTIHGDIEYLYTIEKDGTVRVEVPVHGPKGFEIASFRVIAKIPLGTKPEDALKALETGKARTIRANGAIKGLIAAGVV